MAPTLALKPKICLRLDVHSNHHQTACVYNESSLLAAVPQFQSFEILCGIIQRENFVSPCDYWMRMHVTERSRVLFIHDFRGCGVSVEIFDRRSNVYEGGSISDQLDKVYLPLVVQILQELMAVPWYHFIDHRSIKWLLEDICSAMNQKCAGEMREELFAPFCRSEVNRAVVLSDVALKRISSLQYPMHEANLVTSLERVRGSGLASQGLSVGAHESIINPMTNSDGALDGAAMDKNRAGKRKEELFGPKDNFAVGLSDITFTGHGGGLALQGYAVMHQSTNPLTNPGFYHSPEAIQRRDRGSGLANSQVGALLEDNCPVLEERQKIATAPILASMRKICLQLDVHSKHHQTACVYEESSLLGPTPQFQSFTIMQGMFETGRGDSPVSYRIETSGSERSRVSFIHDFEGCGVCVVIFDRRDAIHEGGSIVNDQLDKAYLPLVVQVLQKVLEISRSVVGGTLLKQYIGSGMDEYSALTMRAELDRFCRSEANLAAETALGLSDVALIRNHSLQYCMPKENLVTSLVSCGSSAAVQWDRGLFDFMKPQTNCETSYSPAAIQMVGGSRLVLQGGARMHQRTNPVTNPELYNPYAAIQIRDRGSGLDSQGPSSDGGFKGPALLGGTGINLVASPESYDSSAAIQRETSSRLASQRRDRGSGLANSQELSDSAPLEGQVLQGADDNVHRTHPMKWVDSLATAVKAVYSALASLGVCLRLARQRRDRGSGLANSQGLSDSAPLEGQVLQGADDNVHRTHPMKWVDSLATAVKAVYSALASLGVSDDALEDLESQGTAIPVSERILYYMLSEHNQSVQQWLRDAGTIGAGFSAVYASPSLATQLPAAVAFISVLTAMWLPRKCRRAKIILTKFGAIASIASVMSAMIKHLSPVGMGIAGALLLIPSGVVVLG